MKGVVELVFAEIDNGDEGTLIKSVAVTYSCFKVY